MIYIFGLIIYFVFDRARNKIMYYCINRSIKLILYNKEWHDKNDNFIKFLDWVLL